MGLGRYLDYSLWEESNVGDTPTWAGVLDRINRRKQAEYQPSSLSLRPDCRCNVINCPSLLSLYLSCHDGFHPQIVSHNKVPLLQIAFSRNSFSSVTPNLRMAKPSGMTGRCICMEARHPLLTHFKGISLSLTVTHTVKVEQVVVTRVLRDQGQENLHMFSSDTLLLNFRATVDPLVEHRTQGDSCQSHCVSSYGFPRFF